MLHPSRSIGYQVDHSSGEKKPSDELEKLRERLRKMPDGCPDAFKRQLEEARAEWKRRRPKA